MIRDLHPGKVYVPLVMVCRSVFVALPRTKEIVDPAEVRQYAEAVSRGLTSAGIASSAKHAPGWPLLNYPRAI